MRTQKIYYFLCIMALFLTMFSCKGEDEELDETLSESVRVTAFSLVEDDSVLVNLDTVFFTIDLNKGLIYNADSLPKGTDVSALVANIKFDNVGKAEILVDMGNPEKDYTINYVTNPGDTIDFTGKVTLKVTSASGLTIKNYSLKVNVHQIEPDSLYWNMPFGMRTLPCGKDVVVEAQKSIYYKQRVYSWIEAGSTTTLYTANNPYEDSWDAHPLSLSFTPNLQTIQATDEAFYMLSTEGELFRSEDGVEWATTGRTFYSLQGVWKSRLLGVVLENGVYKHAYYSFEGDAFDAVAVADNFPITGSSPMVAFVSKYDLERPQSIMVGGRTQHDELTGATWGYDGTTWAQLPGSIRPCEGAVLFPYFAFSTNEYWETTEYSAWMVIGGRNEQGVANSVYVSINNGNTWSTSTSLEMPNYIAPRAFASAMVVESDYVEPTGWKMMPATPLMRCVTRASDYKIPYIYIFGGENKSGRVYNEVWRGAIGRLTYPPIP